MKYYEISFSVSAPDAVRQDACDLIAALTAEAGLETFEDTAAGLKGYARQELFNRDVLDALLAAFPIAGVTIGYEVAEAEDRNWNEQWEQEGFSPIIVGSQVVIHDGRHLPPAGHDDCMEIEIDTHLAFGTGNHETTRMMVGALLEHNLQGKRILDCGTGTGILSIAALKRGAAEAVGYDIDEWSVDNARHNAVINGVADRFTSLQGDASVIATLNGTFQVVLANIHRNILLADMPAFCSRLAPQGLLLLSGFYEQEAPQMQERARQLGLMPVHMSTENQWCCMVFRRSS